jgi:hypothetical protein
VPGLVNDFLVLDGLIFLSNNDYKYNWAQNERDWWGWPPGSPPGPPIANPVEPIDEVFGVGYEYKTAYSGCIVTKICYNFSLKPGRANRVTARD